jgi:hypothetical protein
MSDESNMVRPARHRKQFEPRFLRCSIAFLVVALHAGTNEVLPAFIAAARAWDDVVDGERQIPPPAILATIAVAPQNIFPGKDNPLMWHPIIDRQSEDTRHGERCRDRADDSSVVTFNKLRFPQVKQNDRLLPTANCERFVILI